MLASKNYSSHKETKTKFYNKVEKTIEIINQVNEFYNSAWDKLIIVGTIAFAIVGLLVPLLIQWYQKKSMTLNEEKLKNHLNDEVEKIKNALKNDMKEIFDNEIIKFETKIEKIKNSSEAGIYHIQGNGELDKKNYLEALHSFIIASSFYIDAGDYLNLQIILEAIETDCLDKVEKKEYDDLTLTSNNTFEMLFVKIKANDKNGAFTHVINKIKLKVANLK